MKYGLVFLIVALCVIGSSAVDQSVFIEGSIFCTLSSKLITDTTTPTTTTTTQSTTTGIQTTAGSMDRQTTIRPKYRPTPIPEFVRHRRSADTEFNYNKVRIQLIERDKLWWNNRKDFAIIDKNGHFKVNGTEDEDSTAQFFLRIQHGCTVDHTRRCFEHSIPAKYNNKRGDKKEIQIYHMYGLELLNFGEIC